MRGYHGTAVCGRWSRARVTASWRRFTRASDALAAALDIQRAFHAESWPDGLSLKLRIALHTADAQLRDEGNYFGQGVNRCARLRAVAHGGQVVLSRTTHDLVLDRLPEHVELIDLGVHRLRDLGRPEHVFGLGHPDLPSEFPALRSLDTMPNNLPSELTSFVGRRIELAQIGDLLQRVRLLTLTGIGGCGKTRLALQAAVDAIDRHPDGVWWVALARLEDAALLPAAVIGALGLPEVPGRSVIDTLVEHLRAHRAPSTRSRIIGCLVPVDVGRCLAQLREVVSVGIELGGNSRIVRDMMVSNLAQVFLLTAGGHWLPQSFCARGRCETEVRDGALRGRSTSSAAALTQTSPGATPAATSLGD
jgi:hypothetical protein